MFFFPFEWILYYLLTKVICSCTKWYILYVTWFPTATPPPAPPPPPPTPDTKITNSQNYFPEECNRNIQQISTQAKKSRIQYHTLKILNYVKLFSGKQSLFLRFVPAVYTCVFCILFFSAYYSKLL